MEECGECDFVKICLKKLKNISRRDKCCPRENGKFILKGGVKCKIKTKNKNK